MTSYSISDIIGIIQIRDIELNYHQSMVYITKVCGNIVMI